MNEKAQKHRTVPGGACTILLYVVIFVFMVVKLAHLFGTARDTKHLTEIQTDLTNYLLPYTKQIRTADFKSDVFMVLKGHEPGAAMGSTQAGILNFDSDKIKAMLTVEGARRCAKDYMNGLFSNDQHYLCTDIVY